MIVHEIRDATPELDSSFDTQDNTPTQDTSAATSSRNTQADTDESANPHWIDSSWAQSQIHDSTAGNLSVASGSLRSSEPGLLRGRETPSEDDGEEGSESKKGDSDSDRLLDNKKRPSVKKSKSAFRMVVRSDNATPSAYQRSDLSTPHWFKHTS